MKYRKDIQILRGIAVILVVLFHLEIGVFSSGLLGVDLFFVISGFLMAILYDNHNIKDFFLKRALRLLPTYFVTILITVGVSIFIVTPNEFTQVLKQSYFASTFSSNIGFWLQNSYFSKIDFNPLLHLWSLGVEIQFYLIIPILFFFFRLNKYLLLIILLSSLLLCFMVLGISPKTTFFMMPLRVWEFLIGYGIALYFTSNGSVLKRRKSFLGNIGLILILFIVIFPVDGESQSYLYGHPGVSALLISLATGLVLIFGISQSIEKSKIAEWLEIFGKYSYSIYLVHFPIIVLYLYEPFSGTILKTNNFSDKAILLAIITLSSFIMYHFVEVKFKKLKNIRIILWLFPLLIITVGYLGVSIQEKLFTEKDYFISNAYKDRDSYRCGKLERILNLNSLSCNITKLPKEKITQKILLVGDSHADAIKLTFANEAKKLNNEVLFLVSNEPMSDNKTAPSQLIKLAIDNDINTIVLHYTSSKSYYLTQVNILVKLARQKNIFVSYLMPTPKWDRHIPKALWNHIHTNKVLPTKFLHQYTKKNKAQQQLIYQIKSDNFKIYELSNELCPKECIYVNSLGIPLYFDDGHLSLTGSLYLSKIFKKIIIDSQVRIPSL